MAVGSRATSDVRFPSLLLKFHNDLMRSASFAFVKSSPVKARVRAFGGKMVLRDFQTAEVNSLALCR